MLEDDTEMKGFLELETQKIDESSITDTESFWHLNISTTPEHMTILQTTMLFYFYKDTN